MSVRWPTATWRPGFNAGYTNGRTAMVNTRLHYTVGRYAGDSQRGLEGYFQFYLPRDRQPEQYAEVDALCWDSGDWNGDGPGIEFERWNYDEPLTQQQLDTGRELIAWLHTEHGFPLDWYNGPRISQWRGFINHGSLASRGTTADHTDGILPDEWVYMGAGATPAPSRKDQDVVYLEENGQYWQMGFGDYVEIPHAVGIGVGLNGGAVVPIKTPERVAMGLAAQAQADKFMARFGLIPK